MVSSTSDPVRIGTKWERRCHGKVSWYSHVHHVCSSTRWHENCPIVLSPWALVQKGILQLKHHNEIIKFRKSCEVLKAKKLLNWFQIDRDLITGLRARRKSGRPNWDAVFKDLKSQNKGPITVFYCGNPKLAETLKSKCESFGIQFRKEIFWNLQGV